MRKEKDKPTAEELRELRTGLPEHVAIIMDGNGRWAQKRGLARSFGHRAGVENVKTIIRFASDIGLKALTLYAFSTENWKRPRDEVSLLMGLLLEFLKREIAELHANRVRLKTIGDIAMLPAEVERAILDAQALTAGNGGLVVTIAVNYGSRGEMVRTVRRIAADARDGRMRVEDIDEALLSRSLDTAGMPDPDLVIRTSGEKRISNFLLFQSAYAEYIFTDVHWPDFNERAFANALLEFKSRQRRYGGV